MLINNAYLEQPKEVQKDYENLMIIIRGQCNMFSNCVCSFSEMLDLMMMTIKSYAYEYKDRTYWGGELIVHEEKIR